MGWKRVVGIIVGGLFLGWLVVYFYFPYNPPEITPNPVETDWDRGSVVHILPTVNHRRMLVKVSFDTAFSDPPRLRVGDRTVEGTMTDSEGYFWSFDAPGLTPATTYRLKLETADSEPLTDPWPLETYPAPDSEPRHFRMAVFTCPAGHPANRRWFGLRSVPLEARQKMIERALSFEPDAMVSLGDQVYYDLRHGLGAVVRGKSRHLRAYAGRFDRSKPVLGTPNERVLRRAVSPQLSYLYGVEARSTPSFFLQDDHDYFEDDVAMEEDGFDWRLLFFGWRSPWYRGGVSFPADDFMLELARTYQHMYLPEFLPDSNRPSDLPGSNAVGRPPGVSETYGTLRYGNLLEGLLFEGRRYVTLAGKQATTVHPEAERWLKARMQDEATTHVVNLTALPFGWADGSWMEWYPEDRDEQGRLTTQPPKYRWQSGWFRQHNRILEAAGSMEHTRPFFIGGDHHNQGAGRILESGDLDLRSNPVTTLLSGSLGSLKLYNDWIPAGNPIPRPPGDLTVEESLKPIGKNGFLIVDFTPKQVKVRFFAWGYPEPQRNIDSLEPHSVMTWPVPEQQPSDRPGRRAAAGGSSWSSGGG